MSPRFANLGQRYQQALSNLIAPAIRGVDAGSMTPKQREQLLFSEALPQSTVEPLPQPDSQAAFKNARRDAERIVLDSKASTGKTEEQLASEISYVAKQLEQGRRATKPVSLEPGPADNEAPNLMLRALLSDPADTSMTALLSDKKFAAAVGSTPDELLQTRQQLNDAAVLASRVQNEGPLGRAQDFGITQNPEVNTLTLLSRAREQPSNANLNAALNSIRSPMVTRTADPSAWDASADIDIPWSKEAAERELPRYYKNPLTEEMMDRGAAIEAPSEGRLMTEDLSSFLNRAYGPTSTTADALPGKMNSDIDFVANLNSDSTAARAWAEANQLRAATEAAEAIGATAGMRAGAMTTPQKLQRLRQMQQMQGDKIMQRGLDPEVSRAVEQMLELEGRPLSSAERKKVIDDINANRPGVIDDALTQLSRLPATENLDGSKITAQVLRAADRAGVNVSTRASDKGKQFRTQQAQHLHDFLTSPKLGLTAASVGALTAAGALAAGINRNTEQQYNYTKKDSGEPFSNSTRDEALYRLRMADPVVVAQAIQAADSY